MPLKIHQDEINRVRKFYETDEKQRGFNLLLLGAYGSGKTPILLTCRKPVWIDSFDPKGTVGLRKWIDKGEVMADVEYEEDDPYSPTAFGKWEKNFKRRYKDKFFDGLGTYVIDSSTTFTAAAMNFKMQEASRAGQTPQMRKDYNPAKIVMQNYIRKCLNLKCDFILTGHLKTVDRLLSIDKVTGIERRDVKHRYDAIGQAARFIPLMFSEIYVVKPKETAKGIRPELLINATGEYVARSKLSSDGLLKDKEDADIKAILKKVGLPHKDKPLFEKESK